MDTKYGESVVEIESKEKIKLMFNKEGRLTFIKADKFFLTILLIEGCCF